MAVGLIADLWNYCSGCFLSFPSVENSKNLLLQLYKHHSSGGYIWNMLLYVAVANRGSLDTHSNFKDQYHPTCVINYIPLRRLIFVSHQLTRFGWWINQLWSSTIQRSYQAWLKRNYVLDISPGQCYKKYAQMCFGQRAGGMNDYLVPNPIIILAFALC